MNAQVFWKKNGSTILTVAGGIGLVTTTALAVKATPKALKKIEEAKEEPDDRLSKWETIKVAGSVYIPTILVGAGSLACIFGAHVLSQRQQASLASAYALLDASFKDYKRKSRDENTVSFDQDTTKRPTAGFLLSNNALRPSITTTVASTWQLLLPILQEIMRALRKPKTYDIK